MGLVGETTISDVEEESPQLIWEKYADQICCSEEEYLSYVSACSTVFAIKLSNTIRYKNIIFISWVQRLLGVDLHAPQSYLTLENNKEWSKAISLAAYMQACFQGNSAYSLLNSKKNLEERTRASPLLFNSNNEQLLMLM